MNEYSKRANPISVGVVYDKVDFRKNEDFCNLIRQVVSSDYDYQIMMNSNVHTTEFMEMASGKFENIMIEGYNYSITLSQYMGEEISISVSVNGHEYHWEESGYANAPLYPSEEEDEY